MSDTSSTWPPDYESERRRAQRDAGLLLEPSVLSPVGDDMDYRPKREVEEDLSVAPW
ncbi:MAG TPA: hypothetical protein VLK35_17570 [Methylomirabilota bacterium]|nr:hypothetical protein [Methylomirabilota bacterium]